MAINYALWTPRLKSAITDIDAAALELVTAFGNGLSVPFYPSVNEEDYGTGRLLFGRIIREIEVASAALLRVDQSTVQGKGVDSEILFDDILKRQRKLFEAQLLIVMLTRDKIWSDNMAPYYFLHVHLVADREELRLKKADLSEAFGIENDFINRSLRSLENRVKRLPIDQANCTWSRAELEDKHITAVPNPLVSSVGALLGATSCFYLFRKWTPVLPVAIGVAAACGALAGLRKLGPPAKPGSRIHPQSAKEMFFDARQDFTSLERVALGLTYRSLFGVSSGQIHFNVSRLHTSTCNESEFLNAIDQTALLCVCLLLRLERLVHKLQPVAILPHCNALRQRFEQQLPNALVNAVFGEAGKGDLVSVFKAEGSGNFVGEVIERKERKGKNGHYRYCAYKTRHVTGGNEDWHGANAIMLLVRRGDIPAFLQTAVELGFVAPQHQSNLPAAMAQILGNQDAVTRLGPLFQDFLPKLFFVQEYVKQQSGA